MEVDLTIAALAVTSSVLVGVLTAGATAIKHLSDRLRTVELDLRSTRTEVYSHQQHNKELWLWARGIIDLYYIWRKPGAPEIPQAPEIPGSGGEL